MKKIKGGVCAPQGFLASGISSGVKQSGRKDLSLIVSDVPATLAAVFTKNKVKPAPVLISHKNAKSGVAQVIITNSGNANCATGPQGLKDAKRMVAIVAKELSIPEKRVLVTSTGVIGKPLKMDKIIPGIKKVVRKLSYRGSNSAAEAILTTDTFKKEIAVEVEVGDQKFSIGGIAKGSGMIHPNMATMHAFITTDAKISHSKLQKMLKAATEDTFNMISVDQDTSTSDCVFVLANGLSGVNVEKSSATLKKFETALHAVCEYLAKEIARDGEGATKLITVTVKGAATKNCARLAAREITTSPLVKTAIYGEDPNFGRIIASLGASGVDINPDKVDIKVQGVTLLKNGVGQVKNMGKAAKKLKAKEVAIDIDLKSGKNEAVAWGCDLTYGYIKINARYHT
ncbi:MAG: bifunctional glutamate N-acetyltransferase/amino-acid acetyltransferase ArgJ [Candidatus Margulisbacteria bacterium]|nr:bifunctional glutamate N-acetyltransferase/amino-acid acetyltransferase ArgJ [Candidatus Margulisiibacteriota bacterium]MBU1022425.1 bifunctional glutamate N-acetyltransferase/amino-acid acetyltransferase ArgJ [Candidatus Margulisiibacteriota bacterium]MBU1728409.1 bifunctional glutamate N-acetyltransferase/amino-acid acetyltransferase ArgJ [Candidatus Margulisiibacteriota bacterium]MBU1954556.1 bifunctional glutamate N-acetyltransferase/amino-acid acetyltransferase ArgJ [Candidatus Margulisi